MSWIGQKTEPEPPRPARPATAPTTYAAAPTYVKDTTPRPTETSGTATIGKSVLIKGELSGNESVTIDGRVDGKIVLSGHNLTVGPNGHVSAEVQARSVIISGEVRGNISATDRVEIAATGTMHGDIRSPRVALADGANFRGKIDMEGASGRGARPSASAPGTTSGHHAAEASEVGVTVDIAET